MINVELLQQMMAEGYIRTQVHPDTDYTIYNYTAKVQYDRVWNEVTLQCRGLVLDSEYNYIARPFAKFFNWGEMEGQNWPDEPMEVYEKMDGSLGILYWIGDEPYICTRGSFISEQSQEANRMLQTTYKDTIAQLKKDRTYLFEIIYPENRIVVDYADERKLVLLAIIDIETGKDLALEDIGFPLVKRYDNIHSLEGLLANQDDDREGYVVRFKSGLRYKIKFEEYLRIHRIVTQVSTISIWEYLKTGQSLDEILERVPDEFYQWVKMYKESLELQYKEIEATAIKEYETKKDRKATAMYFQQCQYPSVMFAMLDGKSYDENIWRMLRPEHARPFTNVQIEEQ